MKKIILLTGLILCILVTGCGKQSKEDVISDLSKKIDDVKAYNLTGQMEIMNNEDSYKYNVNVSFLKEDNYKVSMINNANNHEQVILKNNSGVYVLTPSLNKSFKFQSSWPYNNSQVYLLQSIMKDLKLDKEYTYEKKDGYHIFTNKVNYPNNKALTKQVVFIDEQLNIKEVQVLDETNKMMIKMVIDNVDFKATFADDYYNLDHNLNQTKTTPEETKTTASISDSLYPMYLPENTFLTSREEVGKENGQRVILTFEGDVPFTIIEETVDMTDEYLTVPTYGDLDILTDTVGVVGEKSISWVSNGIEYYITSEVASKDELIKISKSISVLPVMK